MSKTRLKFCILGLNFVSDLAQVGEVKCITSCNILAVNNNSVKYSLTDYCLLHNLDVLHGRLLGSLEKNCLFPTKASASLQANKVCQLGQDVCSAGNTFEKIAEGCR